MRLYKHCDGCEDDVCDGLINHNCTEHCEDPHLYPEHETGLAILEALVDMGMSERELERIAISCDVSNTFRKYLIDNLT